MSERMNLNYSSIGDNAGVLAFLKEQKASRPSFTVLDVGASMNPWTAEVVSATFDFNDSSAGGIHFHGSLNDALAWAPVLEYVARNGKFSYSVCTHTLEDVAYPALALEILPLVSEAGYITMPSARQELTRNIEGPWRGYIHHRWIFRATTEELILVPKVPFIEYLPEIGVCPENESELRIHWEKDIPFTVLNNDYLGPNVGCVREMYEKILCSSTE